jgi:hypothetical protein
MPLYLKDRSTTFRWGLSGTFYGSDAVPHPILQSGQVPKVMTRLGEPMPNWRQRIKNHTNATTTLIGTQDTIEASSGFLRCQRNINGVLCTDFVSGLLANHNGFTAPAWADLSDMNKAVERATVQYFKRAAEVQRSIQGTTVLGEMRETLRMLKRPGQGIKNLSQNWLSDVKKLKQKKPNSWSNNLSGTWLEGAFGWSPFIADAKSLIDAVTRMGEQARVVPISAYGVDSDNYKAGTYGPNSYDFGGGLRGNVSRISNERAICKFKGAVVSRAVSPTWGNADLWGFSPQNWIPTAWELLPWSFLADYFSNIGNIIESSCFDRSYLKYTSMSQIRTKVYQQILSPDYADAKTTFGFLWFDGKSAITKWTRRTVTRGAYATFVIPSLQLELPGHPAQWANMTALFAQANAIHPQSSYRPSFHR